MQVLIMPSVLIIIGLILLVWSADTFIQGAIGVANKLGIPTLLIGIIIIGFGTSFPELIVSATSALKGNPSIALGNAYGSNICNIGLILGVTAIISPTAVQSGILKREFPILIVITLLSIYLLRDLKISRIDSIIMLIVLFLVLTSMIIWDLHNRRAGFLASDEETEIQNTTMSLLKGILYVMIGLSILIASSHLLVQNSIKVAHFFGVSDLIIGLTIIALGTSLPELASAVAAARRGENGLVLGNVIGSNIFNTLAVVGVAGTISQPFKVESDILSRDIPVMLGITIILFIFSYQFLNQKGPAIITRVKGTLLLGTFISYNLFLFYSVSH